jgi:hypothetical protein
VTSWLGNTPNIAMKHYLMTTEEHFARALGNSEGCPNSGRIHWRAGGAKCGAASARGE